MHPECQVLFKNESGKDSDRKLTLAMGRPPAEARRTSGCSGHLGRILSNLCFKALPDGNCKGEGLRFVGVFDLLTQSLFSCHLYRACLATIAVP